MLDALGGEPGSVRLVRAPGRVNLIGDHTDYNAGWCLPMAIDRDCWVAVRRVDADRVRARSLDVEGEVEFTPRSVGAAGVEPPWGRFVAGAAQVRGLGGAGWEVVVASSVPPGSGLSSSAALCVALVVAFGTAASAGQTCSAGGRSPSSRSARTYATRSGWRRQPGRRRSSPPASGWV